ncbi:MAG TPA: Rrf2 family transcriptional regulator [Chitinophagaceae bacterium]|mgnify:CR=1 FL=1|nr:Rrf2 family transcriptional regulator [Chitinophagaceae bacterium]
MFLSKSFGYALRGILYVSLSGKDGRKIQVDEIADQLSVPRHFLAKVMKSVVKNGILDSTKGPYGGFSINKKTFNVKLIQLMELTDGTEQLSGCVLSFKKCNSRNPCPLHDRVINLRDKLITEFSTTTLGDLVDEKNPNFIKSISVL